MTIETNQFIVTNTAEIEKLAHSIIAAEAAGLNGYGVFLKSVVGTTQAELGSPPRFRNVRSERLDDEKITAHLTAFEAVYKRFYEAVKKAAEAVEPKPNADELRSRTKRFHSSASTVRSYIRAGNDVRALAAHKVTKAALAIPRKNRKFSMDSLKKRAASLGNQLAAVAKNLNAANKEIARETVNALLAQIAGAAGMTEHTSRDPEKAVEEGIAFHTRTGVFLPINLEAVREQRRAA